MNQRKRAFCEAYLLSGNATKAATEAGYSAKTARSTGQRLLTFADVQEYLTQRNQEISAANTADVEEIRRFWTLTMRDGKARTGDRLKASELLAKSYGAFLNRVGIDGDISMQAAMEDLTTEELRQLVRLGEEYNGLDAL